MLYIIILISLIILTYHYDYKKASVGKLFWYNVTMITLILTAGFRYRLGADTVVYESIYNYEAIPLHRLTLKALTNSDWDPLYTIFQSLARSISSEFWVLQLLQATLVNCVFFRFFRKNTSNIFLAVLLYFITLYFSYNMETMRESCAVAMFLIGYEFYKKKNIIAFTMLIFLAFMFHTSAVLLFIFPIILLCRVDRFIKINKYTSVLLIVFAIIGFAVQSKFFAQINVLAFTDRMADKAEMYNGGRFAGQTFSSFGIIAIIVYKILVPYIVIISTKLKKETWIKDYEMFVLFQFIVVIISIPIVLFYRFDNYFMPFVYVVISNFCYRKQINMFQGKRLKTSSFAFWIIIFLSPIIIFRGNQVFWGKDGNTEYNSFSRYLPYSSIFTKNLDKEREAIYATKGK